MGKWVKYNQKFLFILFKQLTYRLGQTSRQIFTLDGSNDADSCKGVPVFAFVDIAVYLGCKIAQNPQFWEYK